MSDDWNVEQRIRLVLVYLETLKAVAAMVDENDQPAPGFDTRQEFAQWVSRMAEVTGRQVALIERSLSVECLDAVTARRPVSRK